MGFGTSDEADVTLLHMDGLHTCSSTTPMSRIDVVLMIRVRIVRHCGNVAGEEFDRWFTHGLESVNFWVVINKVRVSE